MPAPPEPDATARTGATSLGLGALFFFSGALGLLYEIVWFRRLHLTLGVSLFAVGAVVSAYMLGLAVGSRWAARSAWLRRAPLVAYAGLELGVALYAIAFPLLVGALEALYPALFRLLEGHPLPLSVARFVLAFVLLLPPTFLMGASLPAMAEAVMAPPGQLARRVAWLYALNTVGGVAGTLLTGFLLIEHLGITGSLHVGAAGSAIVAAVAFALARPESIRRRTELRFGPVGQEAIRRPDGRTPPRRARPSAARGDVARRGLGRARRRGGLARFRDRVDPCARLLRPQLDLRLQRHRGRVPSRHRRGRSRRRPPRAHPGGRPPVARRRRSPRAPSLSWGRSPSTGTFPPSRPSWRPGRLPPPAPPARPSPPRCPCGAGAERSPSSSGRWRPCSSCRRSSWAPSSRSRSRSPRRATGRRGSSAGSTRSTRSAASSARSWARSCSWPSSARGARSCSWPGSRCRSRPGLSSRPRRPGGRGARSPGSSSRPSPAAACSRLPAGSTRTSSRSGSAASSGSRRASPRPWPCASTRTAAGGSSSRTGAAPRARGPSRAAGSTHTCRSCCTRVPARRPSSASAPATRSGPRACTPSRRSTGSSSRPRSCRRLRSSRPRTTT